MATFSTGSLGQVIQLYTYVFVCLNGFHVSGCARLFIPDVCCQLYDTSVIAGHSKSSIGYNRRVVSSCVCCYFMNVFCVSSAGGHSGNTVNGLSSVG